MFLPLSDAPNPRRIPWVTYALILANVLVYVLVTLPTSNRAASPQDPRLPEYVNAMRKAVPPGTDLRQVLGSVSEYDLLVFERGYRPARPQVSDLFTLMFLHGGFMHLFGNMLFLWIYGDNVEHRLGRFMFLLAYLGTGVAATLSFALMAGRSEVPMIGASGAISGMLGFYFVWFPRNVVRVLVFLVPVLVNVIAIPARIVLGIYLIVDNILPLFFTGMRGGAGVAYGAHIGGFVAGVAAAWLLGRMVEARPPHEYRPAAAGAKSEPDDLVQALARGDMNSAALAYFASPQAAARLPPEQSLYLGTWLLDNQHPDAAQRLFLRHIRQYPDAPGTADAWVGAGAAMLQLGQLATAYQYLRQGLEMNPSDAAAARAMKGLQAIQSQQKFPMQRFAGN